MSAVTRLLVTAVKGTRVREVAEVSLGRGGASGNRRFYVVDERDRMVNGKVLGALQTVVADYDESERILTLTLPTDRSVSGRVDGGPLVQTRFFSTPRPARLIEGPWSQALSEHLGGPVRLVAPAEGAVDRGADGAVSAISTGSLERLAAEAGVEAVDPRRFRMLIEVDGLPAHGEDEWVGRRIAVGESVLAFHGHVGRCLITSRDPDSGEIDLPTLDVLRDYRGGTESTEPLPFGIYGQVLQPGPVRVGDSVRVLE